MKLYATTTSERASKGQGGNEVLDVIIQVEGMIGFDNREEVLRLLVRNKKGKLAILLTNYLTGKVIPIC
jgi:hypothetical protein